MANISGNFLDLPAELCRLDKARYVVLPVSFEGTVSYMPGTADGPAAILDASALVEWFDEELMGEYVQAGIATLPTMPPQQSPEDQMRSVKETAWPIVQNNQFLLTLGGEHSITAPLVELMCKQYGKISVLQIDAHADLRDTYRGTRLSHGAVMRRVLETCGSICQVGIRSFSRSEAQECPEQIENLITPHVMRTHAKWIDRVLALLGEKVYITIDIDGFDPAYAPGTGTPEPDGMDWQQVTTLLRRVCRERQVVSADIVEVRPIPPNHITEYLAARLAYKLIAYTQAR